LEAFPHKENLQNQENALQAIVDDLTTKKMELEAKLMQMTEKATSVATELQQLKENLENNLKTQNHQPIFNPTANEIFASIMNQFLAKSRCATEKQQKEFLLKILGNKLLITTLLYSGSIHGWNYIDFHSRSDNKGPTISLFKIKDGDCIGGYTNA
jgi:predicted RNase H-like nuclease (RuvC/YqgF family)